MARGVHGTSLDQRFGRTELQVYKIKVVDEEGGMTQLVFPLFEKEKACRALMLFANAPDVSFVSMGKELA